MKWCPATVALGALALLLASAGSGSSARAAASRVAGDTTFSYVLRAGRDVQELGNLRLRGRRRAPTYADAIRAFGKPSWCRIFSRGQVALARWKRLGVRIWLATLGGLPPGKNGCSAPWLIYIDTALASGGRWHTVRGLQVGDAEDDVRTLYPNAIYQRRPLARMPAPAYWIVHVLERCVIGICPRPFHQVARLTAQVKAGKVVAFVFPVGAQGE
jgi:hypothetical protein